MTRKEKLEAEGWERASVLDEARLEEVVALYREIGYEVRTFPFDPKEDGCGECDICYRGGHDRYVVYIRRSDTAHG